MPTTSTKQRHSTQANKQQQPTLHPPSTSDSEYESLSPMPEHDDDMTTTDDEELRNNASHSLKALRNSAAASINGSASPGRRKSPRSSITTPIKKHLPTVNHVPPSKLQAAWTRVWTSAVMFFGGFLPILYAGHPALLMLLFACQIMMFKEVKRLTHLLSRKSALPSFRPLQWYWFCIAIFFTYGKLLEQYFNYRLVPYHSFISFLLYAGGVVLFVLTLRKGYYKYQFEMFAWVHLTLIMVVVQSTFIAVNIFQGMIWFVLPAMLIIFNDSWAWFFGVLFGRTPLIKLSPKKTVEGFIGGACMTLACGFLLPYVLSQYQYMICPKSDLTFNHPKCTPQYPFVSQAYHIPALLQPLLHRTYLYLLPIQLHGIVLGAFASLIGPFGGFFASGFKRAFGVKDFGETIPGHGGVTDRMDCQVIMGLFVFVYYFNFIAPQAHTPTSVAGILQQLNQLSHQDRHQIYSYLQKSVVDKLT